MNMNINDKLPSEPLPDGYLTTEQVAEILGITQVRVNTMIRSWLNGGMLPGPGRLPAITLAGRRLVKQSDLAALPERKRGRPKVVNDDGGEEIKRPVGRPRIHPKVEESGEAAPKKKRGRPRKDLGVGGAIPQ